MFDSWRAHRRWSDVAPLCADSIEGELACVTGIVNVVREILVAPQCERDCVAWSVRFHIGGGGGQYGTGSVPAWFETFELRAFTVDAGELGAIVVDGDACVLELPRAAPLLERTGDPWRTFCDERSLDIGDHIGPVEEHVVEPDVRLSVYGILVREMVSPTGETGFRDAPTRMRLTGTFDQPITITLPRDDA